MIFDHIDKSHKYLEEILYIIRSGVDLALPKFSKKSKEEVKTQTLVEEFNVVSHALAAKGGSLISSLRECVHDKSQSKEDIYFFLHDSERTKIFYAEAKRLPRYRTKKEEEYIVGKHTSSKNASGGIERYKLGFHGDFKLRNNAIIAYVEEESIDFWLELINAKLSTIYPNDSMLKQHLCKGNEFVSHHEYSESSEEFRMHHFWIDLTHITR